MSITHIPFYPSDFLVKSIGMTSEETGVYITIFCLCGESESLDGLIYISEKKLSKACGTSKGKLRKILKYLDKHGFIYEHCGGIGVRAMLDYMEMERKASTRPAIPMATRQEVFERDKYTCVYCGEHESSMHIDHVKPWSKGGTHDIDNLVLACVDCNLSKGAKTIEEWGGRK